MAQFVTATYIIAKAVLLSDRNNSMRCLLHGGILRGMGACEISDGQRVDVRWSLTPTVKLPNPASVLIQIWSRCRAMRMVYTT